MLTATLDNTLTAHLAEHGIHPEQTSARRWRHPVLFDRVVWRLVSQQGLDGATAVRAVDAAWGFLELCTARPELPLSPTPLVDDAWHATILFTRQYVELCTALGVQGIIHHEPHDHPSPADAGGADTTLAAFEEAGIEYDAEIWQSGGPCGGCDIIECVGAPLGHTQGDPTSLGDPCFVGCCMPQGPPPDRGVAAAAANGQAPASARCNSWCTQTCRNSPGPKW